MQINLLRVNLNLSHVLVLIAAGRVKPFHAFSDLFHFPSFLLLITVVAVVFFNPFPARKFIMSSIY